MNTNEPIYMQLAGNIRKKILSGEYRVGQKIMSEREMSEAYGLTRVTVRRALEVLLKEGYLTKHQGKGTFVENIPDGNKKIRINDETSMSLSAQIRQSGFDSKRKVISLKKVPAEGELKDYFPDSKECYELIRLNVIDEEPAALQVCYFPASLFRNPERYDFADGSLYTYMDEQGHFPNTIISDMSVEPVPEKYEAIMKMTHGKLLFYYQYFSFDKDHTMIEYTNSYYNPKFTGFVCKASRES